MSMYNQYDHSPLVDVHIHSSPQQINQKNGLLQIGPEVDEKNIQQLGIKTAILSPIIFSSMVNDWPSQQYTEFSREVTLWQAEQVKKSPTTRGNFAPIPIQDVNAAIEAIKWCETEVIPKPDGYALPTSVREQYFGNPYWDPIWKAFDQVNAVLFVHPNETILPSELDKTKFAFTTIEYPQETCRTIMEMIEQGTFIRYPNIRWIFCHNGGTFPFLYQRIVRHLSAKNHIGYGIIPKMNDQYDRIAEVNQGMSLQEIFAKGNIYLEGAQGTPAQHQTIKSLGISASNLLCGSDLPFTVYKDDFEPSYIELRQAERSSLYTAKEVKDIYYGNALRLFPRLKEAWKNSELKKYTN